MSVKFDAILGELRTADNVQQNCGTLSSGTVTLVDGGYYAVEFTAQTTVSYTFSGTGTTELRIKCNGGVPSITWDTNIKWADSAGIFKAGNPQPTMITGRTYVIVIRNDGVNLLGNLAYIVEA